MAKKSIEERIQDLQDADQILSEPQFLLRDAARVCDANEKAIITAIEFEADGVRAVDLHGPHITPGRGKRRVLKGADVLQIRIALEAGRVGFPFRWRAALAEMIAHRASNRMMGLAKKKNLVIISFPDRASGEWRFITIYDEDKDLGKKELPLTYHILHADRLIDDTIARLKTIIAHNEGPDFSKGAA